MLRQRQEAEAAALHTAQKLQDERRLLQERLGGLQRALAQLEAEKREAERSALRLEKDRVALKRTLDKVGCSPGPPSLLLGPSQVGPSCMSLGSGGFGSSWSLVLLPLTYHASRRPPSWTSLFPGPPAPLLLSPPR